MPSLSRQLTCDLELLRSQLQEGGRLLTVEETAEVLVDDVLRAAVADITGVGPSNDQPPPALPTALKPYELQSNSADPPEPSAPPEPRRRRPKAPKGRKRPTPALTTATGRPQEPLSDRSALSQQTAQTTASSRHTSQTSARSTASRVSSKAGRPQRVVSSEERLESKYRELEQMLSRDFAEETARVCAESLREARQILHCTTAASRMVCGVVSEAQRCSWAPAASRPAPEPPQLPTLRFSLCEDDASENEIEAPRASHRSVNNSARSDAEPKRPKLRKKRGRAPLPKPEENLVGYGVDVPKKNPKPCTDHQLGKMDNDLIRRWLKIKNRQARQEKKRKRDEDRLKREIDEELQKVEHQRREESMDAFRSWKKQKDRQIREERRQKSTERRSLSPRTDAEGRVQVEGEEEEEEEEEKKERRGPRPIHNYVFPRPASPPHVSHSPTRPPTRMRVRGEPLSGTQRPPRPETASVRLSYDDWLKRKRSESAKRRRAEEEKARDVHSSVDPDMERIVPEMARQRLHESREAKRRVNSAVKPKPKPRKVKPEENGEIKENGPPGSQPYEWRMERQLRRPQSAKATLASRGGLQPRGRRPEPCGTEHPGGVGSRSTGAVLDEIIAAVNEEEEEEAEERPLIPRLEL